MNKTFAKRLTQLRTERDLSQRRLAAQLGCSQSAISKYELADNQPDIDFLVAAARYFNVSADWLLGLPEHRRHDSRDHAAQRKLQEARKAAEALRDSVTDLMDALREEVKVDKPSPVSLTGPRLYMKIVAAANGDEKVFGYAYGEPWIQQALFNDDICFGTPEAAKAAWEEGLI